MCRLSYYLISFNYEGFRYVWSDELESYYSVVSKKEFKKPPAGASWDDACWISQWRCDDND